MRLQLSQGLKLSMDSSLLFETEIRLQIILTRSIRDSETSIDFVQGPPGSRREWVKTQSLE